MKAEIWQRRAPASPRRAWRTPRRRGRRTRDGAVQQVGTVELVVVVDDPGQLGGLAGGELLRVLPPRVRPAHPQQRTPTRWSLRRWPAEARTTTTNTPVALPRSATPLTAQLSGLCFSGGRAGPPP